MNSGVCRKHFKIAEIAPIHKDGPKNQVVNYRPIALISNMPKIFEKVIHKRLFYFLTANKIIYTEQYGFFKGKGTNDAIAKISDYIYKNLAKS